MLTKQDNQKRWRQALISATLLVGTGLFLVIIGGGAPVLAAQRDMPASAMASGAGMALALPPSSPLPTATACVPANLNYNLKQTTGSIVAGSTDAGLHCS